MKKTILLILLLPMLASAQYFDVFDIDTSEYPIMKAKFYSIDANGKQILNHTPADFEITENGEPRDVISVSCPDPLPRPISVGIMVDTKNYINLARHGSERLVNLLNMPQNEVGITYMDGRPLLYQDFTSTKQKAIETSKTIPPAPGGTKVSEMLFDDFTGGINLIKNREAQNRVLIFISDLHCPNIDIDEQKLFQEAEDNNIKIYTVLIETGDYTGLFGRIAKETNGFIFENVKNSIDIDNIFEKIAYREQNELCEIIWESKPTCKKLLELEFYNKEVNLFSRHIINLSDNQRTFPELLPYFINFGQLNVGDTKDTAIIITAHNGTQIIDKVTFEPELGYFDIHNSLPLTIEKGESIELKLTYKSVKTDRQYVRILFSTDLCDISAGLLIGSEYKFLSERTLDLTHPNGGEVFYAGADTIITWEGISKHEIVKLNFSSNNGKDWSMISDSVSNLSKDWSVPRIKSDGCLISIEQYSDYLNSNNKDGDIEWSNTFAGSGGEDVTDIIQTTDGGYVFVGRSSSTDIDLTSAGNKGYYDVLIVKYNSDGQVEWSRTYGGDEFETAESVLQTSDGGYILAGYSRSIDGDLLGDNVKGEYDIWVLKLKSNGDLDWSRTYGGSRYDYANTVIQTSDGGYIIAGNSNSNDGDVTRKNERSSSDIWIIKLKSNGDLDWSKTYGGSEGESATSMHQTYDGGFIITGTSSSEDGDLEGFINKGKSDLWVFKIENNGDILWSKTYGGSKDELVRSIIQTTDGGYITVGSSLSTDGDLIEVGNKGEFDIWVLKLNINGELDWSRTYGGNNFDIGYSIIETNNAEYIVVSNTASIDGDLKNVGQKGKRDILLLKLKHNGDIDWNRVYGGAYTEEARKIINTNDGGYVVAGWTQSNDGDLQSFSYKGPSDIWVIKFFGTPPPFQSDTSDTVFSIIMSQPVIQNNDIDMGEMIVGNTKDTIVSSVICNTGDAPLHVLGVDITDAFNSEDFLIPRGAGDFYLEKDSCQDMMFEFTPSALGNRTAVATIRTAIGDFTDTIHIRGVGINPIIEPKTSVVDFGKIKLGLSKDTTVFIIENKSNQDINITNTSIIGPDMDQFEILSIDKTFTVPANQERELKLRFVSQYTGRVSTIIEFEYDDAIVPLRSMLFAEGISDVVQTITDTIDFGNVRIGNIKDTNAYLIKNLSSSSIDITDMQIVGPDMNQFSIQESDTDFSINGYDSLLINLRFAVTNPGKTTTTIESYNYFTSTKLETVLLGNGVGGAIQPFMDDAFIGDNTGLELHLNGINPTLLTNIATNFTTTVSYNSTLLAPIDKSMNVSTEDDKSFISITGQLSGVPQIAAVPMKVGLGTADKSGLVVTEFQLYDANGDSVDYDIEPGVGEFNVLGICEEGGQRLLNPDGEATLLKLLPNRTSGQTTVEMTLIESGQTELTVYDQIGNKIETIFSGNPDVGTQEITLDLSQYANGRYYIKLTTPTISKTEILEVVR